MIKDVADLFAVKGEVVRQILEELRGDAKDALALSISEAPPSSNTLGQYRYFKAEQLPLLMRLEDPAERRAALEDIADAQSLKVNNLQKALAAAEKEAREAAAKGSENEEPSDEEEAFAPEPNTQAATLVRYAEDAELFRTPDGEAYVTLPVEES
jgi:DNA-binding transcriptional MerR regulator